MRQMGAFVLAGATLAIPVEARTPDYPGLDFCQDDKGQFAEIQDHGVQGSFVLFRLYPDRPESVMQEAMILADCASARAVRARMTNSEGDLNGAYYLMRDALLDSQTHTFAEIASSLRGAGYKADRINWPKTHCVCDFARAN